MTTESVARCGNCGAYLEPTEDYCRYCRAATGHPVTNTQARSPLPTTPEPFILPPRPRPLTSPLSSFIRRLGRLALWAVILVLFFFPDRTLLLFGCLCLKVALAFIRTTRTSHRDRRAISQEHQRVNAENYRRLTEEARLRLDPDNADANANLQILGQLVGKYFPAQTAGGVESWWTYSLGWTRTDEQSPWQPTIALQPHQRWF
jgi:hypothetical protein